MFTLIKKGLIGLHFANFENLLFGGVLVGVFQIVHDGPVEKVGLLGTNRDFAPEARLFEVL